MPHMFVNCDCGEAIRLTTKDADREATCMKCGAAITIPNADLIERHAGRNVSLGDVATLDDNGETTETESKRDSSAESTGKHRKRGSQRVFEIALDAMCCVMVADLRVTQKELRQVRQLMAKLKSPWDDQEVERRVNQFVDRVKSADIETVLDETCRQLHVVKDSGQQRTVLKCLDSIAKADGHLDEREQSVCNRIQAALPDSDNDSVSSAAAERDTGPQTPEPQVPAVYEAPAGSLWKIGDVVNDRYRVDEMLGKGAFGSVWKVYHTGWKLDLAVKELRTDKKLTDNRLQKFVREAQAWIDLGMHPHIVTAWYVRNLADTPYLFLEYCDGGGLDQAIDSGQTRDLKTSLDIGIQLAWALSYCHTQKSPVVHRDFKPQNVILNSDGTAKLTDFGTVKFAERETFGEDTESSGDYRQTIGGQLQGTPAYMPPEQWVAGGDIDFRADLYALGVTLFELLTGELPFEMPSRRDFPADREYERVWREACAETHREAKPQDMTTLRTDLPQELSEIISACLGKTPDDRPGNANSIADRLRQIYQSVIGAEYERINPEQVTGTADSLNNRAVAKYELGSFDQAEQLWDQALSLNPQHLGSIYNLGLHEWRTGKIDDLTCLQRVKTVIETSSDSTTGKLLQARLHWERTMGEAACEVLEEILQEIPDHKESKTLLKQIEQDKPDWSRCLRTFEGHTNNVHSVAFSPDGRRMVSGSEDATIKLWETATGTCIRAFEGHTLYVHSVAFSPDGTWIVSGSWDRTLNLWDTVTGTCLRTFEGHTGDVASVAFSPDGTRIVSGSSDSTLKLWDSTTGTCLRTFEGHTDAVGSVAFSPDGTWIVSGSDDSTLKLWETATGTCLRTFEGHTDDVTSVAFSPDGTRIISGSWDATLKLWETVTGTCLRTFEGHTDAVGSVAFSPDGTWIVSGSVETLSKDKTFRLWETTTGTCLRAFEGHTREVLSVAFSPDGTRIVSGSVDKTLKLWSIGRVKWVNELLLLRPDSSHELAEIERKFRAVKEQIAQLTQQGQIPAAARIVAEARKLPGMTLHPDLLASVNRLGGWGRQLSLETGFVRQELQEHTDAVRSVAFSPDGTRIVSGSSDSTLKLWDSTTGTCLRTFEGHTDNVHSVAFSPDGRRMVSGSEDKTLKLWETVTGTCLRTFEEHTDNVTSVAFSPDGRRMVSGSEDATIKLWETATGTCLRTFEGHTAWVWEGHKSWVSSVVFSPDGCRTVSGSISGSSDNTLKLWETATGTCLRTFEGHTDNVSSVAFSPDGTRIVSGSCGTAIKLWETATGTCLRTFEGHTAWVSSVAFSPDGTRIVSGSCDETLKLWETVTGTCLRTFEGHTFDINSVAFSPDGTKIVSGSEDKTIRIWELVWDYEFPTPVDWDEGALPYLTNFLSVNRIRHDGKPKVTKDDIKQLIQQLQYAGFGWVRPAGIKAKLKEMMS